jgi:hypothetical protein
VCQLPWENLGCGGFAVRCFGIFLFAMCPVAVCPAACSAAPYFIPFLAGWAEGTRVLPAMAAGKAGAAPQGRRCCQLPASSYSNNEEVRSVAGAKAHNALPGANAGRYWRRLTHSRSGWL